MQYCGQNLPKMLASTELCAGKPGATLDPSLHPVGLYVLERNIIAEEKQYKESCKRTPQMCFFFFFLQHNRKREGGEDAHTQFPIVHQIVIHLHNINIMKLSALDWFVQKITKKKVQRVICGPPLELISQKRSMQK